MLSPSVTPTPIRTLPGTHLVSHPGCFAARVRYGETTTALSSSETETTLPVVCIGDRESEANANRSQQLAFEFGVSRPQFVFQAHYAYVLLIFIFLNIERTIYPLGFSINYSKELATFHCLIF